MSTDTSVGGFWFVCLFLTFKTLTSCLVKEILLATVIRYVTTEFLDPTKHIDLVVFNLSEQSLTQVFKRWVVDSAFRPRLDKTNGTIFGHFGLFC